MRRKAREREERAREEEEQRRREWEKTPEGQAHLEQQRREAAEVQRWLAEQAEERRVQEGRRRLETEERMARAKWNAFFESRTVHEIASMTGLEFEEFLARLLSHLGYTRIVLTPINDQGGDIICASQNGEKVVVQAKRWKGSLGNSVVQEILGAMLHYGCNRGMIVTNSTFTSAAKILASKDPRIMLCDGSWLKEYVDKCFPSQIPPFDWERYKKEVMPVVDQLPKPATIDEPFSLSERVYSSKNEILADVAEGRIEVEEASRLLAKLSAKDGWSRRPNR